MTLEAPSASSAAAPRRFGPSWWIGLAAFGAAFFLSLLLHRDSALHDTDSYFHLAIARLYAEEGVVDDLPALRMSLLRDGYGDKELLFHLALVPLVKVLPPLWAGRVALSLFAGLIAGLLAFFASRFLDRWAFLFPFWLFFASTELSWRLVRLRPELLSLTLLLLAAWAMATRRDRLLGAIAAAYTLGYTAFHAFQGLVLLVFVVFGLLDRERPEEPGLGRRWPWRMLLYSWLGCGLGLILHPHFPKNLVVFWVQNVVFFAEKAALNVGSEIRPNTTDVVLLVHLGLFCALAVLVWAARRSATAAGDEHGLDRRLLAIFAVYVVAFGGLYALMSRFSLYFWPFAGLALLLGLKVLGLVPGRYLRLGSRQIPVGWGLLLALLLSTPEALRQLATYRERTSLGPNGARIVDRERFSAALPAGATVAADWGPTATYLLWAPQGLYLNALDPNFMATLYPAEQAALREILEGRETDVPGKVTGLLASRFLAFPAVGHEALIARLQGDPRARLRHKGSHFLVEFVAAPELIADWRLAPGSAAVPIGAEGDIAGWPVLPAASGFVDGEAIAPDVACLTLVRDIETPGAATRELEWVVQGRARLWRGGEWLLEARGKEARLGEGVVFPLVLTPGRNRLTVQLCEREGEGGKAFYWRERG